MAAGKTMTEKAEKRRVTLISLAIAVLLILLKLFVGLSTGYLTLISEALHSSLDALVTIITFFSIRYAEKPADTDHPYGHGKAENLAAFTESILLFFAIIPHPERGRREALLQERRHTAEHLGCGRPRRLSIL